MQSLTTIIARGVDIGKVIRNAAIFNFRNWRGGVMPADALPETVSDFFSIIAGVESRFLLAGGIALLQYEDRNTEGIDLIMALSAVCSPDFRNWRTT